MHRRELSRVLLASVVGSGTSSRADTNSQIRNSNPFYAPEYPVTEAESRTYREPVSLIFAPGNVLRWGADPTGALDSTVAIQSAMNVAWATGFYNSPWSGNGGATPVIVFPPGRYRVTDTITVPTGVTIRGEAHPANTSSHTRIIMDSSKNIDNRNRAIFRFNRATLNDAALMNTAVTSTIQDLEFWFVTPGGTFDLPISNGIEFGHYPCGAAILFDVDSVDFRIINCAFQHSPAAIRIMNVPKTLTKRGDKWEGNRGVGIFIENCEFDAACSHVYASQSELDLQFKGCQFYGGMHRYEGCTGKVVYQGGRWHGAAFVDAKTVPNSLQCFCIKGADIEISGANTFVSLDSAQLIDISQNTILGFDSNQSWIEVTNADGGCVNSNAINNSGGNARPSTDRGNSVAVIKLLGCRHLLISSNNITATDHLPYNGFGILTLDGQRESLANYVSGNAITAPYLKRSATGESRCINTARGDVVGANYTR